MAAPRDRRVGDTYREGLAQPLPRSAARSGAPHPTAARPFMFDLDRRFDKVILGCALAACAPSPPAGSPADLPEPGHAGEMEGAAAAANDDLHWVGTWANAPQPTEPRNLPPEPGLAGNTLRQILLPSIGGSRLRLQLSNAFGSGDVVVQSAHLARSAGRDRINPSSDVALTFPWHRRTGALPTETTMQLDLTKGTIASEGRALLAGVSSDIRATGTAGSAGLFLSAQAALSASRQVFELGTVPDLSRYTLCHRFEPYWMRPAAGRRLSDVPPETQMLLGELECGGWLLLVPLIGDRFRFSLRGTHRDHLELYGETGDAETRGTGGLALFVADGDDPFELVAAGARAVSAELGMGKLRLEKPLPDFVDRSG